MEKFNEKYVIFLDFDGVLKIKDESFNSNFEKEAINRLNELCELTGFCIVVCSSWREHIDYKSFLHTHGLNQEIPILGKTEYSNSGKRYEIKKYIDDHKIKKYIIIEDDFLGEDLVPYQVQTAPRLGFTENKYKEALIKISKL